MRKLITMRSHLYVLAITFCLYACQRQRLSKNDLSATGSAATMSIAPASPGVFDQYTYPVNSVATLAGSTIPGFGDGKGAARFDNPSQLAMDASGNLYIADMNNNRIRKMTPDLTVTTLAGTSVGGYQDGPVATAQFQRPTGIAIDTRGYLYVADMGNERIRVISPDGVVSTLAGTGVAGFADGPGNQAKFNNPTGVAVDALGTIYVADRGNNRIRRISPAGVVNVWVGDGVAGFKDGPGALSELNGPTSVAVGPGNAVYVADPGNNRIRKIVSGVMTTVAGSGVAGSADGTGINAQFNGPYGVAVDGAGNILVTDVGNHGIREITPAGVVRTQFGRGGAGVSDWYDPIGKMYSPLGITLDVYGNAYVCDDNLVRKLLPGTGMRTIAGGLAGNQDGVGPNARFRFPWGVKVDGAGNIFVSDFYNQNIRKIAPNGMCTVLAGAEASISYPTGMTLDPAGNLYVCEQTVNRIRKITPQGGVSTVAGSGARGHQDGPGAQASFYYPWDITRDASGNLYVADYTNVRKIDINGVVSTLVTLPTAPNGEARSAQSIVAGDDGNLLVGSEYYVGTRSGDDDYMSEIWKVTPSGSARLFAELPRYWRSKYLAYDPVKHHLYSTVYQEYDAPNHFHFASHIIQYDASGQLTYLAGGPDNWIDGPTSITKMQFPLGIAVGPDGALYFSDSNSNTDSAGIRVLGLPR